MKTTIFWFRRDLRLNDNIALYEALSKKANVLPLFIFDEHILEELPRDDARVYFIYKTLQSIHNQLHSNNSSLLIRKGKPEEVWAKLLQEFTIDSVFINKDYEPYAIKRDAQIKELLHHNNIPLLAYKDQVVFEESEVMKADGTPYTVFTPYKNKWLSLFDFVDIKPMISYKNFHQTFYHFPSLKELGFVASHIRVKDFSLDVVDDYETKRNFPALDETSYLGPHLRFGTISIRQVIAQLSKENAVFFSELIWREFFMQILFHFPKVVSNNFKAKYDGIKWLNHEHDFQRWCEGNTGYPMVDAGMRQLNQTGYMHNRVRMVVASFLCKHLLIDWRLGEAYFAQKLLDYELASNNGNWQWAAGTGCDAAPYFRVFNPTEQAKKFDAQSVYIRKWVPEIDTDNYPDPMVDHSFARKRAIDKYKKEIIS
jgi:deoxyribodipyrimidine photo-lyase